MVSRLYTLSLPLPRYIFLLVWLHSAVFFTCFCEKVVSIFLRIALSDRVETFTIRIAIKSCVSTFLSGFHWHKWCCSRECMARCTRSFFSTSLFPFWEMKAGFCSVLTGLSGQSKEFEKKSNVKPPRRDAYCWYHSSSTKHTNDDVIVTSHVPGSSLPPAKSRPKSEVVRLRFLY